MPADVGPAAAATSARLWWARERDALPPLAALDAHAPGVLVTCSVAALYALTVKVGLLGNCWVVGSVLRSRRPRHAPGGARSPSDRLRTYIALLAVLDLLVIAALVLRVLYVLLPQAGAEDMTCRVVFVIDHLVKLASLSCLSCISLERYITIRKPFSARARKRFIQLTPLVAMGALAAVCVAIAVLAGGVGADAARRRCVHVGERRALRLARWLVAASFGAQLCLVALAYSQIVRHVRRKFWQRKARVVAHASAHVAKGATCGGGGGGAGGVGASNGVGGGSSGSGRQPPQVSQPRYMRDMTAAIVRIALFHVLCWLPYCTLKVVAEFGAPAAAVAWRDARWRLAWAWAVFFADWLTYVSSAGNWILYAAMNKDLRSIIRATTERRKRSTLSQSSPPSNLHRSLRRHISQSLRFFYSINSYRSNGNSFDESLTRNGSVDSSSPAAVQRSASNAGGGGAAEVGLFGMRNGRAHTYCSPRASQGLTRASSPNAASPAAAKAPRAPANAAAAAPRCPPPPPPRRSSPCPSPKPILIALMGCPQKSGSQERFL